MTTLWEGELVAEDESETLAGSVAAVSRNGTTEAAIQISGATADAAYPWGIRRGSCEDPGEMVGAEAAYPPVEADDMGGGGVETVFSATMSGQDEHHAVLESATGADGVIACAELSAP